ncbi:MAG: dihydropteroate synthase [Microbacteriaceae bacterium]|nr:dihydropteroate synthase [Microbacteriaceae bacterium]
MSVELLTSGSTRIVGILNMTPDSFSDGGKYLDPAAALQQAQQMIAAGASIIDVGGESTRPGAVRVDPTEEQARIIDTVRELAEAGITVSVDTINASTAALALAAGAQIINDVSGGLHDPEMYAAVAEAGACYIAGHWRGFPSPTHSRSDYDDVAAEVADALAQIVENAVAAGITRDKIVIDPGLGFDKTGPQCWEILRRLEVLQGVGRPLLIGASRKRMLAEVLENATGNAGEPAERDLATAVVSAFCAAQLVWGVRVHNVAATQQALAVAGAWCGSTPAAAPGALAPGRARDGEGAVGAAGEACGQAVPGGARAVSCAGEAVTANAAHAAGPAEISLRGLEVFAHHGVFAHERENGQPFTIDCLAQLTAAAGGAVGTTDDLAHTVNYAELAHALYEATAAEPVNLIETLADRLGEVAMSFPAIAQTTITVHKPQAPIGLTFGDVAVTRTFRREAQ